MARLSPRRREAKAKAGRREIILTNLSQPKVRPGRVDVKAARVAEPWLLASACSQPPQGSVFTARTERPWLVKRYRRWGQA